MISEGLTFDDVLLVPQHSTVKSRSEVDLSVNLGKNISLKLPFIPANMADIIGKKMIIKMYERGALSILHRFSPIEKQISLIKELSSFKNIFNFIGVSVGVKSEDYEYIKLFSRLGIKIICIDIAHLDSILGLKMVEHIHNNYPNVLLIAGNVATGNAAARAWKAGADVVKVGIGASGICSTRLEAGAGVPQLSALMDVYDKKNKLEKELYRKLYFISDGGHRQTADCVKSLCFADLVMLGGMFAGTDEAEGNTVEINGEIYKSYSGSSTHKQHRIEGVKGITKSKGSVDLLIKRLSEGLQSGCSYQNCHNLQDLKEAPEFVKISNAAITESNIHDITIL
jgi:IMP dehydrogenase